MLLSKNERFLNDYKKYQDMINNIDNIAVKEELQNLLRSFVNEVKKLDFYHADLSIRNNIGTHVSESKNNLISIRKKLEQKISDCEKAGFIKKQYS